MLDLETVKQYARVDYDDDDELLQLMLTAVLDDLTEKKQQELLEVLGDNGNYDVYPLATIEIEEEETMAQAMN